MVISFAVDEAFDHLRDKGYVVTFRESRRKHPNCETWCNRGRGEPKAFDVRVSEICHTDLRRDLDIAVFAAASGFGTASRWRKAIGDVNTGAVGEGWLYLVVRADAEPVAADGGDTDG